MLQNWISAFRLRTLPLSLACVGMGAILAIDFDSFDGLVFFLCCLVTLCLQILSNLSNDYGDAVNGIDNHDRIGPKRAVQSGNISKQQMKYAVIVFTLLSLFSGIGLLFVSFGSNWQPMLVFFGLGILCIVASIGYTVGRRPYGYLGLGDISVMIFFGGVGVMGTLFLFTHEFHYISILPAMSCGFFSVAVININNIRDIESDKKYGKLSLPVRMGKKNATLYHWFLLSSGIIVATVWTLMTYKSAWQFIYLATIPLLIVNGRAISNKPATALDSYLRQMALTTLLFVVLCGVGVILKF